MSLVKGETNWIEIKPLEGTNVTENFPIKYYVFTNGLYFQVETVLAVQRRAVGKRQHLHCPYYRSYVKTHMEFLLLYWHLQGTFWLIWHDAKEPQAIMRCPSCVVVIGICAHLS